MSLSLNSPRPLSPFFKFTWKHHCLTLACGAMYYFPHSQGAMKGPEQPLGCAWTPQPMYHPLLIASCRLKVRCCLPCPPLCCRASCPLHPAYFDFKRYLRVRTKGAAASCFHQHQLKFPKSLYLISELTTSLLNYERVGSDYPAGLFHASLSFKSSPSLIISWNIVELDAAFVPHT